MFGLRNALRALAIGTCLASGTTATAATIDLGFGLDASGSVGTDNFNATRNALAGALALIPFGGANVYRVAVSMFSDTVTQVVSATTIDSVATRDAVRANLLTAAYTGGLTRTDLVIADLASQFAALALPGDITLLNITTDGEPTSQFDTALAVQAALTAGVDGISFEAIGDGINDAFLLDAMASLAVPNGPGVIVTDLADIPDPTQRGFVIAVNGFDGYAAAITAKIGKVVIDTGGDPDAPVVPLPAGLPLLLGAFGMLAALRARRNRAAA